jgi:tRNA(fMet)-specific endonuclease VapC
MYYLDSNTVIYFLNGRYESVSRHIQEFSPALIRIPAIVKAELLAGAYNSQSREKTLIKLNLFLKQFMIESFDDDSTKAYAKIYSELKKKGTLIGSNDALIAATVLAHGGVMVTHNVREFKRVRGLKITDWVEE